MKQTSFKLLPNQLRIFPLAVALLFGTAFLFSFTARKLGDDFLKQLGLSKTDADNKISKSILGGYLDQYGIKSASNIAVGNRSAIVKDLIVYTRQYVNTEAFIKEYNALKESEKPRQVTIQTPEEMRLNLITMTKKSISETEANLKNADRSLKTVFESLLAELKSQLKEAENPANEMMMAYNEGYPDLLKSTVASNKQRLEEWETKYPSYPLLFVKRRLQEFLDETADLDFSAQLAEKNGKKYFVNKMYESKNYRWKMAFRAGKEVVVPARQFVQQWINEI